MAYAPYFTVFESNPINSFPYLLAGRIDIYSLLFVVENVCKNIRPVSCAL